MKREIKFKRVFQHSETGRICITSWGNVNYDDSSCTDFSSFKSPSNISGYYPIADLQFTGLKDKNGKEIFEGDIVKFGNTDIVECEVVWDNKLAQFRLNPIPKFFNYQKNAWDLDRPTIEIIGNIYENPELLK